MNDIKKFWNNRPCNIKHSNKEVGTLEYFNEVTDRRYFVESHILKFAKFNEYSNKKILDIGCGIGTDSISFASNGASVTAIDLSNISLDLCKKRFDIYDLKGQFYQGDIEKLNTFLPKNKYDLIYSFGVIHHTPNPEKVMEQIIPYCKKETEIKIMLYAKYSWKVFWILLKYSNGKIWKLKQLIRENSEAQFGSPITYVYSKREIKKLFKDFDLIKISKRFIFPYKIEEYKKYKYKIIWYFKIIPKFIFDIFQKMFGWHFLITAKLKEEK